MARSGQQIADLETHRAINYARYAGSPRNGFNKGKRRPETISTPNGRVVTQFLPRRRYVTGNAKQGSKAKYTHLSRVGWLCWLNGKPVGMAASFLCGGLTFVPEFTHEQPLILCPKCCVAEMGYDTAAKVLDNQTSPSVES